MTAAVAIGAVLRVFAQTPLIRFVVDLLYNLLYNKSTTNRKLYNILLKLHLLKALSDRSGDRSAGGRRFHAAGPLTAKLRCPVAVRTRGTSRVPVAADRRC